MNISAAELQSTSTYLSVSFSWWRWGRPMPMLLLPPLAAVGVQEALTINSIKK